VKVVTSVQMRELDRRTIELGTAGAVLMERAGKGIAAHLLARWRPACRRGVLVVAGRGNNGGDGFVVARLLRAKGYRATVALLATRDRVGGDARLNLDRWLRARGRLLEIASEADLAALSGELRAAGLVLDAILGTGLNAPVTGLVAAAIEQINARGAAAGAGQATAKQATGAARGARSGARATRPAGAPPVVAVDLPSGLDGDTGEPWGVAVRADATVTLGCVKLGLVLPAARPSVGALELVDIGLDERAFAAVGRLAEVADPRALAALVPRRRASGHKGSHGHLLVVAGSRGKSGAAILCGRAALRAGAGLVTVACPATVQPLVAAGAAELMTDSLDELNPEEWAERLVGKSALVVGPGLGQGPAVFDLVAWLAANAELPIAIDADGLNALAGRIEAIARAHGPVVLTPHPGEMARLVDSTVREVQADRVGAALRLAREARAVVVLKGAGTLIAAPDGGLAVNTTGGPLLGTGGTGDVLAGLIGSLLAQGLAAFDAARLGVYLHGLAGDRIAERIGDAGLLASELADELPLARRALLQL
jgi:ADP-dependent NAD(P)H-hydrate dehydratase / NAD(P)H-hydrate epimerase